MKHPEKLLRKFNKTDEEMLQLSDVKRASFEENKSRFVDCFPELDDPFSKEWEAATQTARGILPDYVAVNTQTSKTEAVEKLMEEGRNLFQTLMLYTQLAFPDDSSILRLMGQSQYDAARNSQLKLPVLLRTAFTQASKPEIKAVLIAKGMKDAEIATLDTLAESILTKNQSQEKAKTDRSLDSDKRIMAMNAVWDRMALVCKCAKLVFQNDAGLYSLFLLVEGEAPAPEVPTTPTN